MTVECAVFTADGRARVAVCYPAAVADSTVPSTNPWQAPPQPRHTHLASRAYDAVRAAGAPVPAELLTRDVFGLVVAGPAARWASLLDDVLTADGRFRRTPDGWSLATAPSRADARDDRTVVAISISTTGADPRRHRVVRLSAVRRGLGGGVVARLDTPLNPRRRLAGYLQSAARVNQDDADQAPAFGDVVDQLREFVADDPIHAYGAGWARGFLDAELARLDLPGLPNPYVELADAVQFTAARGKPTLAALANGLGINHPRPGFPPADADVAARVALAARASDAATGGGATVLSSLAASMPAAPPLLDRRWLDDVPACPGAYVIEDAAGMVLYVGKAVDLRRRLTAYVGRAFGLHRQLEGLAVRAARVRTEPTETDVEARLLEARLLRRHRPPFNVQRRVRRSAAIIRVAPHDRASCVRAVRDVEADGALYFGPYRSARAARADLELVRAIYPAAVGRGAANREARRAAVHAVAQVLSGQKDATLRVLRARMRQEGLAGDALGVEQTRRLIRAVLDLEPCPSPLLGISPSEPLLVTEPLPSGGHRAHLVRDGFVVASTTVATLYGQASLLAVAGRLRSLAGPPDDPEDAHIVLRWLAEPRDGRVVVPLRRLGMEDTETARVTTRPGPG